MDKYIKYILVLFCQISFCQGNFNFGDPNHLKNRLLKDVSIAIFVNTFTTEYDTTDYFSKDKIISIKADLNFKDSLYRVYKDVTLINGFEKTIKIKYSSVHDALTAFNKLITELKYVSNGEIYGYVVGGAFVYLEKETISIVSLNGFKNPKLFKKCKKYLLAKNLDKLIEIDGKLIILK